MKDLKVTYSSRKCNNRTLISSTKALYYENLAEKLNNQLLQAKTYWSILKTFYKKKKSQFYLFSVLLLIRGRIRVFC